MNTNLKRLSVTLPCALLLTLPMSLRAQTDLEVNEANNPLTPKFGLDIHDSYVPDFHGTDDDGNTVFLRGILPHNLFGLPQLFRATLPIISTPDPNSETGLGDLNVVDLFLFKAYNLEFGVGPQLTLPTATHDVLGTGKSQLGIVGSVVATESWGLLGGEIGWQHGFAGDDDRPEAHFLTLQPIVTYNLPYGFYARSTATWYFNLDSGNYYVPIGLGAGKVVRLGGDATLNFFVEPQFTIAHDGPAPRWQIFMGVNLQFSFRP
jgi:hypothetical protein